MSSEVLSRLLTGAFRVWGEVGVDEPPFLVLPLIVEPSKPRLCLDARFLNLWMKDMPFTLDKLVDVQRYVFPGSFMTKCDDKSGYDHVLISDDSQKYFGFEFGGLWFVCTTLPFGWKISPYIYHTIGLAASSFLRVQGVPCSLYIDDRLNGELLRSTGFWSVLPEHRSEEFRFNAANAALFVVLAVLVSLGYTIGIKKSVLHPTTSLEYLGFIVDSVKQCFLLPRHKILSWAVLREHILQCKSWVDVKTLQRFQGKCISFSLAVPAAKLFIREMSSSIGSTSSSGRVSLSSSLKEELLYWRFLDKWDQFLPWREEKHYSVSLSSDASGYRWGCVLHLPSGDLSFGDYWNENEKEFFISTKEMLALVNSIKALPEEVRNCRVDAYVDSKVLIGAWQGQGSKSSPQLTKVTKELFFALSAVNIDLRLHYLPSKENEADAPSRQLSRLDSKVSASAFSVLDEAFGGEFGHSFDLMALDSNVPRGRNGFPLPHFTPSPSPHSDGVNLFSQDLLSTSNMSNPYVFPPFNLIGPVLKFLYGFKIPFTIIIPEFFPRRYWHPELLAHASDKLCLCEQGDMNVILAPSKTGFRPFPCPLPLWAYRVSRF